MLPVFRPLTDRAVLTVWSGLCTSTIGEDLFRVASVWLAVEVAGNMLATRNRSSPTAEVQSPDHTVSTARSASGRK